jgi:hypothetical protein
MKNKEIGLGPLEIQFFAYTQMRGRRQIYFVSIPFFSRMILPYLATAASMFFVPPAGNVVDRSREEGPGVRSILLASPSSGA